MTVVHELSLLHRILVLVTSEWGIRLPQGIPKIQLPKRPHGRDRRLFASEEEKLLRALESAPIYRDIVVLAIETGMRRGEILNMCGSDLDVDKRTLCIPETKTGVPREIPLSNTALAILKKRALYEGDVFNVSASQLSRAFAKACEKAGLNNLRFHDSRHEATSRFFELGLNVMEVASITGHRSLEMLNRYTHLRAEDLVAKLL